jgi:catechol 2,3-dioxygenase-like lactoylglutathione lyase family enzyme
MAVTGIHHFNLRVSANELDTLQGFYCDVLGLYAGARPPFQSAGVWLYAGETPLIHLTQMHSGEVMAPGSPESLPEVQARRSAIDHIAFASEDLGGAERRLNGHGVPYTRTEVPGAGDIQLFFRDPSGNGIELVFAG